MTTSTNPASSLQVPLKVKRLAVVYPRAHSRELISAYSRLEVAAFLLKVQRPALTIVERQNLRTILAEQSLQMSGAVSDDAAIHVGRLLGVDGILLYRIESPTMRDQVWARFSGQLPPVLVTSKVIMVESGEVVFHALVTASVDATASDVSFVSMGPLVQAAMNEGITQTITDLQDAFR
ncbi:MAG: hypothetical protein H0W13_06535 [Nitrospirales bacterium]|nr:hypothetical protein [Nitrospirales bacterium]MBA3753867.1 hypothetical protein [Nitrospira sp.]